MLAASSSAPNTPRVQEQSIPTPAGWHGVKIGMENARSLIADGAYEQAIDTLNDLLLFAPAEVSIWRLMARLQRKLGRIEDGIASANRALQLQNSARIDSRPLASLTLAKLLWRQGEKKEAREMLELLLARSPEDLMLSETKQQWRQDADA